MTFKKYMRKERHKHTVTKRVHWIDICRGIAIILVIYGHLFNTDQKRYLIYAFHMPLFFFISGLVFKPVINIPLKAVAMKYTRQLLFPYYMFAVLTYFFAVLSQTTSVSLGGAAYQLFGILYGSGRDGMLGYNVVLWFLPCLFITKLTFAVITRKFMGTKVILFILLVSAISGSLLSFFAPWIKLPFGFEIALNALPFLGAGYLFASYKNLLAGFMRYKLPIATVAMTIMAIAASVDFHLSGHQIDMRINQLDVAPLFYFSAFSGIIGWTAVSQLVSRNAFLEYIGRHSLIIFAWHNILLVDLRETVGSLLTQNLLAMIHPIMSTVYTVMAISIILFSRFVVTKLKLAYRFVLFLKPLWLDSEIKQTHNT
jgi:acyltransferase